MSGTFQSYLQLMRLKNVLLAAITVPLGAQFAIGDEWATEQLAEVVLQILAVVFFIGAGNTMNDIKDVAIDREAHLSCASFWVCKVHHWVHKSQSDDQKVPP